MAAWQRDIDEIRKLLLEIEAGREGYCTLPQAAAAAMMLPLDGCLPEAGARKLAYHLELLDNAGFARFSRLAGGNWVVHGLTWAGHEFLDNIRCDNAWGAAKDRREALGGFSMAILAELARDLMRARAFAAGG